MMRVLSFTGHTLGAGLLMALFILVPGVTRFLFSVIALLVGVRFFRYYESRPARVGFISATVVVSLAIAVLYVPLAIYYGWPVNAQFIPGAGG